MGDHAGYNRGLVNFHFAVVADFPPLRRARLMLWADAAATASDVRPAMVSADRVFHEEIVQLLTDYLRHSGPGMGR